MFKITESDVNKDLLPGETLADARDRYYRLWGNFMSQMPDPDVHEHEGGQVVLRADLAPAGLKSFGAEKLVAECEEDTLVYVAPRVGHAPDAIATLAEMYGKKCVFFCPAARRPSRHQAALLAHDHVRLKFIRIAAMPVLNKYAREWAEKNDARYLPFGLTNTPSVTAGIVNMCRNISRIMGRDPTQAFMAVSTGTMIRAMEIAWPETQMCGMAVARNMKAGEIGGATVVSHSYPFLKDERSDYLPPFPSTANYDAKAWSWFNLIGLEGSIFINVGSDDVIERNLERVDIDKIHSQREWGDLLDMDMP